MLRWLRTLRTVPTAPASLWQEMLSRYPFLGALAAQDVARLKGLSEQFLATKEFHGAQGFVITDAVALAIAAQAVLPVLHLGLGLGWYDDFVGIVVHPDEVVARRNVTDENGVVHHYDEVLSGEAMDGGPVMLSWSDVHRAGDTADSGYNVVIHEFIHKIDMRNGAPDGCPQLPSRAARDAWMAVMSAEFTAFREKTIIAERFGGEPLWLDDYGATAIDEFFAVSSEAYFVNRPRFEVDFPALATLFDSFFLPSGAAAS